MTAKPLGDVLADRIAAERALEEGWAGTFLIEPLTALAGGILGGATVAALAWRLATRRDTLPGPLAPRTRDLVKRR